MSLTREQWEAMWKLVKQIERDADYLHFHRRDVADRIKRNCEAMKRDIESVIGQME
jgi:hypothetical protein